MTGYVLLCIFLFAQQDILIILHTLLYSINHMAHSTQQYRPSKATFYRHDVCTFGFQLNIADPVWHTRPIYAHNNKVTLLFLSIDSFHRLHLKYIPICKPEPHDRKIERATHSTFYSYLNLVHTLNNLNAHNY